MALTGTFNSKPNNHFEYDVKTRDFLKKIKPFKENFLDIYRKDQYLNLQKAVKYRQAILQLIENLFEEVQYNADDPDYLNVFDDNLIEGIDKILSEAIEVGDMRDGTNLQLIYELQDTAEELYHLLENRIKELNQLSDKQGNYDFDLKPENLHDYSYIEIGNITKMMDEMSSRLYNRYEHRNKIVDRRLKAIRGKMFNSLMKKRVDFQAVRLQVSKDLNEVFFDKHNRVSRRFNSEAVHELYGYYSAILQIVSNTKEIGSKS